MKTWYRASNWGSPDIVPVQVERESDSSVWIKGRVHRKYSNSEEYFTTWEKAHAYLCGEVTIERDRAFRELERHELRLANIKSVKKPID